jgi:hypothetical protein
MPQQPTRQEARARYNAKFNNRRYKVLREIVEAAVQEAIIDIHQEYATTEIMNLVIDACMYACEHPHYDIGTLMRMASQLSTYNVTKLGESITDYLRSFNPETAKMFSITLQAYQKAYNAKIDLIDWCHGSLCAARLAGKRGVSPAGSQHRTAECCPDCDAIQIG